MMMKLLMSNTQGVRTYLGLFQVIMANVAVRDGRGRHVGVWWRVGCKQKVNFRGVETEFRSNWTPTTSGLRFLAAFSESGPHGAATVGGI